MCVCLCVCVCDTCVVVTCVMVCVCVMCMRACVRKHLSPKICGILCYNVCLCVSSCSFLFFILSGFFLARKRRERRMKDG